MKRQVEIPPFSLTYKDTEEIRIDSGIRVTIPAQEEDAFCFAMKEGLRVELETGDQQRRGKVLNGELFLVPAGCNCTMQSTAKHESHVIRIRFLKERLAWSGLKEEESMQGAGWMAAEELKLLIFRMPQIRTWMQDFISEVSEKDQMAYYQLQSYLYAMVSAMMGMLQNPREPEEDLLAYVAQTRRYMVEQFQDTMDIEKLAVQSGTSGSRFYRAFRSYTGLSPHKFITKVRLDASLSLLANSSMPIIDVAHSIGYTDEYYFSRLFKKQLGMAPTEFAALAQKKIVSLCRVFNGDLEALGITPMMSLKSAWTEQLEEGLAMIAAAEPEWIITGPVDKEVLDALSAIAPTVMLHWKQYSWKERFAEISEGLGLSSVAERWLMYYDLKVENARFHLRRHLGDEPLLLVTAGQDRYHVFGTKWRKMRDVIYEDLQVSAPTNMHEFTLYAVEKLEEVANMGYANVLFFVEEELPESFCRQLEDDWRTLNSSSERHLCLFVRYREHLQYNASMHGSLVEQMVRQLLESV